MKPLTTPRAVLAMPEGAEYETLRQVLATLGIEGYRADRLQAALGMAARMDTFLVVLDSTMGGMDATLDALRTIRSMPGSQDVLIAIITATESLTDYQNLLEVGANGIDLHPLTKASSYRMIGRMARRARLVDGQLLPPEPPESSLVTLKNLIAQHRGRFKIYLGAAPGVGKTFSMLNQAHELVGRGEDVAVGIVETHGRRETAFLLQGLEVVPQRRIDYKGTLLSEMDLDAILERCPGVVLVDELAHTNVPGSLNAKRYEDVLILRLAGISVVSTVNIQHLESLNNIVERITGVKVRETVPDWMVEEADEVVLVDIEPEALQQRLREGKIYGKEKVTQALSNFFTTHNLTALRELVLRELADRVDERLEEVRAGIGKAEEPTGIVDRIMICVTPTPTAQRIIRRGMRLADRLGAELFVLHVEDSSLSPTQEKVLAQNIALAESLEARIISVRDPEIGLAIAHCATEHQITIILLGESRRSRLNALIRKPILDVILQETSNIDVVIVASREHESEGA